MEHHKYINVHEGSSFYRAPEIIRKDLSYNGEKADVFALGCTLYALRLCSYPFGFKEDE